MVATRKAIRQHAITAIPGAGLPDEHAHRVSYTPTIPAGP
jgi:hypothetical protein